MNEQSEPLTGEPGRWWRKLEDGRILCEVCPRACKLNEGQRGLCFVRARKNDAVILTTYGRSSGFCIDPVEKKPLNHFLPGSSILSFGTAGCNLACSYCQNWGISKSREVDTLAEAATPEAIAQSAKKAGCLSVAYTYNDPVIFAEYAIDIAAACQVEGIKSVAVTAGYVCDSPREEFFAMMDAANIDLKSFNEETYRKVCKGELKAVLETIEYVVTKTNTWVELTTLVVPGLNDSDAELHALCQWVREKLGAHVPLHFTAFHPDYKMTDRPRTPPATLNKARRIAREEGLHFVYCGNVQDEGRGSTWCHVCHEKLIGRNRWNITTYALDKNGNCPRCQTPLPGYFNEGAGNWGHRRQKIIVGETLVKPTQPTPPEPQRQQQLLQQTFSKKQAITP